MRLSRRAFLTASAGTTFGTAVGIGGTALLLPETASACTALHQAVAAELLRLKKDAQLAGNNVLSNLRDMACPCCGEPFTLFKDFEV